ncbi:MAG: hypothetical protein ACE14V_11355 [bacterium]
MKKAIGIVVVLVLVGVLAYFWVIPTFFKAPSSPSTSSGPITVASLSESTSPSGANAQEFFVKAGDIFPSSKKMSDVTATAGKTVTAMDYAAAEKLLPELAPCEPVFAAIQKGVNADLNYGPEDLSATQLMPSFWHAQMSGKSLLVKGMALENQKKLNEAADAYLLAVQFGGTFPGKNTSLIQQLIGIAIEKNAYQPLKQFVLNHPDDKSDLKRIIETLDKVEQKRMPITESFNAEKKCFENTFKHLKDFAKKDKELGKLSATEGQRILDEVDKIMTYQLTALAMPYPELKKELGVSQNKTVDMKVQEMLNSAHPFLQNTLHNIVDAQIRYLSAATDNRLVRIMAALQLYHQDNQAYPDSLSELVPNYLTTVPKDYFTESDFIYGKQGDSFYLYSVGPDMMDNHEKPVYDPNHGNLSRGDIIGK